jgi:hypothetical protein
MNSTAGTGMRIVGKAKVIPAADATDVLREQLEFLIEHAGNGVCGCRLCNRYLAARTILMEAFDEPNQ